MPDVVESRRRHFAVILLLAGVLLIIFGIATILLYHPATTGIPTAAHRTPSKQNLLRLLYLLVLLILVFTISTVAFLRWSRGFRRLILRKPPAPTPADDVWQMYRLPAEENSGDPDELAGGTEPP